MNPALIGQPTWRWRRRRREREIHAIVMAMVTTRSFTRNADGREDDVANIAADDQDRRARRATAAAVSTKR